VAPVTSAATSLTDLSDADLAAAAALGDRDAFACIVHRCGPGMHRSALGMLEGDFQAAEDAVQEGLAKAWVALPDSGDSQLCGRAVPHHCQRGARRTPPSTARLRRRRVVATAPGVRGASTRAAVRGRRATRQDGPRDTFATPFRCAWRRPGANDDSTRPTDQLATGRLLPVLSRRRQAGKVGRGRLAQFAEDPDEANITEQTTCRSGRTPVVCVQ